ncbi:MAG: malonic semialdehyde reductase [Rhodospirillales bacterium]|nr:malonic semialdehyde reductase [Rhodospirillales bacterium]
MIDKLPDDAQDLIFREARTHNAWQARPVPDDLLRQVYDLCKWGPTTANSCPMRIVFVKSPAAKEKLRSTLLAGNLEKTMAAPAVAIIAYDTQFYEYLPRLFTHDQSAITWFRGKDPEFLATTGLRNGSLQGAYFIIAARALGLDCGPMSGFDNAKLDAAFFPDGRWKSNFLINLAYGDKTKLFPRNARLDFDEACRIV